MVAAPKVGLHAPLFRLVPTALLLRSRAPGPALTDSRGINHRNNVKNDDNELSLDLFT